MQDSRPLGLNTEAYYVATEREYLKRKNNEMTTEIEKKIWNLDDVSVMVEQLEGMLRAGYICPLCGKDWVHDHTAEEIVIYRNGVKYGRSIS